MRVSSEGYTYPKVGERDFYTFVPRETSTTNFNLLPNQERGALAMSQSICEREKAFSVINIDYAVYQSS